MRFLIESQSSWEFCGEIPGIAWCHNGNYVWLVLVTIQIRTERTTTKFESEAPKNLKWARSMRDFHFIGFDDTTESGRYSDSPVSVWENSPNILTIWPHWEYRCEVVKLQNCNFLLFSPDSSPFSPRYFLHNFFPHLPGGTSATLPKRCRLRLNAVTVEV